MNNTLLRALTGSLYVALVVASVLLGKEALIGLLQLVMIWGTLEVIRLLKDNGGVMGIWVWITNVTISLLFSLYVIEVIPSDLLYLSFLPVMSLFIAQLYQKPEESNTNSLPNTLLGIAYISIPLVLALRLAQMDIFLVLATFIMIWANDTLAFVFGKWMGKNKLFERLSPKKTIEGFVGGLMGAVVSGIVIALSGSEYPMFFWIVLGVVVGISGTFGDLFESMLKRKAGVKDSGNVIPGHGGVLDRLDSFLFAAPFVYFCALSFKALNLI